MKFDYIQHTIGTHYLSALINLDYSGLNDCEYKGFKSWLANNVINNSHFDVIEEEGFFGECEVSDCMGEVITVRQYFPQNSNVA
jgi:hypothetical protein